MRVLLAATLPFFLLTAQEIMPARGTPGDYQSHAALGPHTLAAEFLGRTVPVPSPAPGAAFVLQHYIVVEIAAFPAKKPAEFNFHTSRFSLRLNSKSPLLAQTPGMVAASLKYPDWENQRQITASGSVGNSGVILGRNSTGRFPGDRRPPTPPPGTPARETVVPEYAPWDWVAKLAWEDGPVKGPAGGLLYFPYKGSLAKLKTIELICNCPEGLVTLSLRGSTATPAKSAARARTP